MFKKCSLVVKKKTQNFVAYIHKIPISRKTKSFSTSWLSHMRTTAQAARRRLHHYTAVLPGLFDTFSACFFYIILLFYSVKLFYASRYNRTTSEGPATSKNQTISRRRLMGEIGRRLDQVVQTMIVYFAIQISQRAHITVTFSKRYCLTLS